MTADQNQYYARPYAEAAYRYAKQHDIVPAWHDFLTQMTQCLLSPEFHDFLTHPFVDAVQLINTVTEVATQPLTEAQSNFLLQLAQHRRLLYLDSITNYFQQLRDQDENILRVIVTSAFPLNEVSCTQLTERLEQQCKKKIILQTQIKPELIGGLTIQMGDRILDASIQNRLAQLIHSLSQNDVFLRSH